MLLEKNPLKRAKWDQIICHKWWEGIEFAVYEYPAEPYFDQFIEKNYMSNIEESVNEIQEGGTGPFNEQFVSQMIDNNSKVTNENMILRLSLNIKKNINREQNEHMDVMDTNQDIKLDKNTTINMGNAPFSKSNAPVDDQTDKSNDRSSNKENELLHKESLKSIKSTKNKHAVEDEDMNSIGMSTVPVDCAAEYDHLLQLLTSPSDRLVKPIIGNPEIEKLEHSEYLSQIDGVTLLNNSQMADFSREDFEEYLVKIYKVAVSNTMMKEKLNLMNYFISFIQDTNNANLIIESIFVELFVKMLKTVKTKSFKVALCTIIGLNLRYTTNINNELANYGLVVILVDLLSDKSKSVKRRAMAALGEYLFYGSTQLDGTEQNEIWDISFQTIGVLLKILNNPGEDEVVQLYALKTIENITSQSKIGGNKFCQPEFIKVLLKLYKNSANQGIQNSSLVALINICLLSPHFVKEVVRSIQIKNVFIYIQDSEKKTQQALMNLINMYLFYGGESAIREMLDNLKYIVSYMLSFFEHGSSPLKAKTLLTFLLLSYVDFSILTDMTNNKLIPMIDKLSNEKSKYIKSVLREFMDHMNNQMSRCLEFISKDLPGLLKINEEESEAQVATNNEAIIEFFNFISMTFTSFHIQD